jgi:GNAT superfamily N-acetyltransferase
MKETYCIRKAYQDEAPLRASYNRLAGSVFGLGFEDWYQGGYWKENYIPYSILDGEEVVANVSVSPMRFLHDGKFLNLIQLGTVMAADDYRNQGLIRILMDEVEADYAGRTDGTFLFANNSVLTMYPKFGFRPANEYEYYKEVCNDSSVTAEQILMDTAENQRLLVDAIRDSSASHDLWLLDSERIVMFYVMSFMSRNVYRIGGAYAIAETNGEELYISEVFSKDPVDPDEITAAFGKEIKRVVLGFTPLSKTGWTVRPGTHEDTTLFVKGPVSACFDSEEIQFPVLSHA